MQTTLSYFHTTFSSYVRGHLQLHSTVPPRPSASETGSIGMRNIGSHLQQTLGRPAEPHPCSDSKRPPFNESPASAHSPIHTFDSVISHQIGQMPTWDFCCYYQEGGVLFSQGLQMQVSTSV